MMMMSIAIAVDNVEGMIGEGHSSRRRLCQCAMTVFVTQDMEYKRCNAGDVTQDMEHTTWYIIAILSNTCKCCQLWPTSAMAMAGGFGQASTLSLRPTPHFSVPLLSYTLEASRLFWPHNPTQTFMTHPHYWAAAPQFLLHLSIKNLFSAHLSPQASPTILSWSVSLSNNWVPRFILNKGTQ